MQSEVGLPPVLRRRWTGFPSTRTGWLSLRLMGGFGASFALFLGGVLAGQKGGDTFFSNPYLATTILLAGAFAIAAGAVAGFAVTLRRERSLLVLGALAWGVFALVFATAEAVGHEEPEGSAARVPGGGTNSHTNLAAAAAGEGEVRVSFDYTYAWDPAGATITAITVSALGRDGQPLPGHAPVVLPVVRGSGHLEPVLSFTPDQLGQIAGLAVCFTGPGRPDLGCARVAYPPE